MLKKLRRQFILSNMLLVGIVIILVFCVLTVVVYNFERRETINAMKVSLAGNMSEALFPDGRVAPFLPSQDSEGDTTPDRLYCVSLIAILDKDGEMAVYETSVTYDYSTQDVRNMINAAMAREDDTGILSPGNVRFLRQQTKDGYRIAFADRSFENNALVFVLRLNFFNFSSKYFTCSCTSIFSDSSSSLIVFNLNASSFIL